MSIVYTSQNEPRYHMRVWAASLPPRPVAPTAGGDIDMVVLNEGLDLSPRAQLAVPGTIVQVQAGAPFAAGADLETDADGRAVALAAGVAVLRALEAASAAGKVVQAVVKSGR